MDNDDGLDFPTDLEAQHLAIDTSESKTSHFQLESTGNPNILSRIRNFNFNNIARSSIGSLFSNTSTTSTPSGFSQHSESTEVGDSLWNYTAEFDSSHAMSHSYISSTGTSELDSLEALTPKRMLTPTPLSQQHRFSDVKRAFNDNRTEHIDYDPYNLSKPSSTSRFAESPYPYATRQSGTTSNYMPTSTSSRSVFSSSNSISTASENLDNTPPLTPDSFSGLALSSSSSFMSNEEDATQHQYELQDLGYMRQNDLTPMQEMDLDFEYTARHRSQEIKEGKKPERPICYDALIEDLSYTPGPTKYADASSPATSLGTNDSDLSMTADTDNWEWYGLEYTLELSCRERKPSDNFSSSVGEHSKSRESWAAIHRGTIHPLFEDEEYYQWKNWHRYLDKQDERRKHRKGIEFRMKSKREAYLYLDEMQTLDVYYWQKEEFGLTSVEVNDRLESLAQHRPDPYHPPHKHGLAWYLDRKRSIGCLRELYPLPIPTLATPSEPDYERVGSPSPESPPCSSDVEEDENDPEKLFEEHYSGLEYYGLT